MSKYNTPFFILRTPLFPLKNLLEFYNYTKNKDIIKNLSQLIRAFSKDPKTKEAIYIATPILYNELIKFEKHPQDFTHTDQKKLLNSLLKYYIRSSSRCTPFGLFASCAVGEIGEETVLNIREEISRHLRLDMDFIYNLTSNLSNEIGIKYNLKYHPNTSIYLLNKKLRYVEYRFSQSTIRKHHLVDIDYNSVIKRILEIAKGGINYIDIVTRIQDETGYPEEEVKEYLDELISNKVLESELSPIVSGEDYFKSILNILNNLSSSILKEHAVHKHLNNIQRQIKHINSSYTGINQYFSLEKEISRLGIPYKDGHLFQMDTVRELESSSLSISMVNQIKESVEAVFLMSATSKLNSRIEVFKRAFKERYESQLVRLVDVMDSEIGIGYKEAKSLADHYSDKGVRSDSRFSSLLSLKMKEFYKKRGCIEISDGDLESFFSNKAKELPNAFTVMIDLYKGQKADSLFELKSISFSISNFFGRFCQSDKDLKGKVISIIKDEDNNYKDSLIAEIVHLPQSRTGNILSRPHLRDFEIEYLSRSTLPVSNRISIDDLYLKIENNTLLLFSKRLKKRIIPRLSSAHNYSSNSLSIYNLLCDLQYQENPNYQIWNWNEFANEVYLPRVVYKSAVLCKARWILNSKSIRDQEITNYDRFKNAFLFFSKEYQLPQYVLYSESDNRLFLDTSTDVCIHILYKIFRKNYHITLSEAIWSDMGELTVKDSDKNGYTNEVLVPFVKEASKDNEKSHVSFVKNNIKRYFHPGSEWLYIKVYSNQLSFNRILLKINTIIDKHLSKSIIKWFFIRYADPKPNLRIRFLLRNDVQSFDILNTINKYLKSELESGLIHNLIIDTYIREVERYGNNTIEDSESIFFLTSSLVVNILKKERKTSIDKDELAFSIICHMTNIFIENEEERLAFYEGIFEYFKREFNFEKDQRVKREFQNRFREKSKNFFNIMQNDIATSLNMINIPENYIDEMQNIAQEILIKSNSSESLKRNLLSSYIHMLINRLFDNQQRFKELFLYYCLVRSNKSLIAQRNSKALVNDI